MSVDDFIEKEDHGIKLLKAADSPDLKDDFCKFVYDNIIGDQPEIETISFCGGMPDCETVENNAKLTDTGEKTTQVSSSKEVAPEPSAAAPEPKPVEPPKVITHVARNGVYIHQAIEEAALHQLISAKTVVLTDHVYHPISINWMTVEEYLKIRGLNI